MICEEKSQSRGSLPSSSVLEQFIRLRFADLLQQVAAAGRSNNNHQSPWPRARSSAIRLGMGLTIPSSPTDSTHSYLFYRVGIGCFGMSSSFFIVKGPEGVETPVRASTIHNRQCPSGHTRIVLGNKVRLANPESMFLTTAVIKAATWSVTADPSRVGSGRRVLAPAVAAFLHAKTRHVKCLLVFCACVDLIIPSLITTNAQIDTKSW